MRKNEWKWKKGNYAKLLHNEVFPNIAGQHNLNSETTVLQLEKCYFAWKFRTIGAYLDGYRLNIPNELDYYSNFTALQRNYLVITLLAYCLPFNIPSCDLCSSALSTPTLVLSNLNYQKAELITMNSFTTHTNRLRCKNLTRDRRVTIHMLSRHGLSQQVITRE